MGKIWVKELTGGLDTRRMPATTSGAVLMEAVNGHINRGGEFEKREAFVKTHDLPEGRTIGLASTADSLYVFGHQAFPAGLPDDVGYQRLQDPNDADNPLTSILSWDLYAGKLYVLAEFAGGERYMFYDGVYVNSWADGSARASFTVDPDEITPAVRGSGSFRVTPGTTPSGAQITSVKVTDVDLITSPIVYATSFSATLSALVSAINARTGTTGFSATRDTWVINVKAPAGSAYNNEQIDVVVTSTFGVTDQAKITGGVAEAAPTLVKLWVGNSLITNNGVAWVTNAIRMAEDIADEIAAYSGTSGFTATASGRRVTIKAVVGGNEPNGDRIKYRVTNGLSFSDETRMAGGTSKSLPRGVYNRTIGQKMYAVAGSVLYFSGIAAPDAWNTDSVGAGFIDMSSEISGAERLKAVVKYQDYIAVFAEETTIIEYVDPDPTLNRQIQVLDKTGTIAPKSVTQFGDQDIYYLDQTGLRSLQARDSSNAAATTDIGVMVDSLILAKLQTMTAPEKAKIIGTIEPQDGRFWLIMDSTVFVLSYFQGSKVSAWTTYTTSFFNGAGDRVVLSVEATTTLNKRLFLRSEDRIFAYGGNVSNQIYDGTVAQARLPYLDANEPARKKTWRGVDAAVVGNWQIRIGMDPNNEDTLETVANITGTTYDDDQLPSIGESTHISVTFRSSGVGRAVLSSCVIHYEGDQIEDR